MESIIIYLQMHITVSWDEQGFGGFCTLKLIFKYGLMSPPAGPYGSYTNS